MALRKAFIFRGGDRISPNDTPLQYLDSSVAKLKITLEEYGNWEVDAFTLKSSDDLSDRLSHIDDSEDQEVLIFYTGHGLPQPQNRYALISNNSKEVLFDNIINPINKFNLTRFVLIIDACHSSSAIDSLPQVDNIEVVTSVTRGLAYESEDLNSTVFIHYFSDAITHSTIANNEDISLEHICNSINQNDEVRQKPLRIPALHNRFTKHITIAPSRKPIKDRPIPNAPLRVPTGLEPLKSIYYVAREDKKAYDELRRDYSLIRIKAPRQYGKTSLLSRLLKVAQEEHYKVVSFNFQKLDSKQLNDLEKLLYYICRVVSKKLKISSESDWEEDKEFYAITEVASEYMDSILSQLEVPLVIAIDEADKLFDYNISNDFFGLIRAWHEESKTDEKWNKLKIILSHSTEPLLGATNINQSPFHNVGLGMELRAFNHQEIEELITTHNLALNQNDIDKLQNYIGGHPYLVRKVLYEMVDENIELAQALKIERFNEHLRRYKIIFEENRELVDTIQEIIKGDCPNTKICYKLEATGFIKSAMNQRIEFSCKLYEEFFKSNF
ncbi:MAG: AAA-like domain-containing protein [Campylobacterota bacterium]|nr:AAA-like domain-containing protein [Campylobacterota bacterium]